MYLKILTGRYAGEIQEFPFTVAQDLIANGRAVRVNYDGSQSVIQEQKSPLEAQAAAIAALPAPHVKQHGKKGKAKK